MDDRKAISVIEFINSLVDEIKLIQERGHHYLSFGLIPPVIELLGACFDNHGWHQQGFSEERFNKALELFPLDYQPFIDKNNNFYLYSNLRCGMLHVILPKPELELIQEKEIQKYGNHLEVKTVGNNERLILVSEYFFKDFKEVAKCVIQKIKNEEIEHQKVYQPILYV